MDPDPRTISKSELARLVGVSPAAITNACRGVLKQALWSGRILVDHPATRRYVGSREIAERRRIAQANQRVRCPPGSPSH